VGAAVVLVLSASAKEIVVAGVLAPLHNVEDAMAFNHDGFNPGSHNNNNNNSSGGASSEHPLCQVCFKIGYDENYVSDSRHVAAAAINSYTVDPNWYTDSGATDHIIGELEKLALQEKYHVRE
jgi:hypothetical protein